MMKRRGRLQILRQIRRHRKRVLGVAVLILISASLALGVLIWILNIKQLNISAVSVSGNEAISESSIIGFISEKISGDYFWVLPKSNIFLYPKKEIIFDLTKHFQRIKSVDLKKTSLSSVSVKVVEYQPSALLCNSTKKTPSGSFSVEECYFLNNDGYVFGEAPIFSGDAYFKFYGGFATSSNPIGQTYLGQEKFSEVSYLLKSLEQNGLKPASFEDLSDVGDYEITLKNGARFLISDKVGFSEVLDNVMAMLSEDIFMSKDGNHFGNISYVDLRFGNKVFYKLR